MNPAIIGKHYLHDQQEYSSLSHLPTTRFSVKDLTSSDHFQTPPLVIAESQLELITPLGTQLEDDF